MEVDRHIRKPLSLLGFYALALSVKKIRVRENNRQKVCLFPVLTSQESHSLLYSAIYYEQFHLSVCFPAICRLSRGRGTHHPILERLRCVPEIVWIVRKGKPQALRVLWWTTLCHGTLTCHGSADLVRAFLIMATFLLPPSKLVTTSKLYWS